MELVRSGLKAFVTTLLHVLQVSEGQWNWDDNIKLETTSAFFTGVYGMWNIYTFALICLYAPSHKRWPKDQSKIYLLSFTVIEFLPV